MTDILYKNQQINNPQYGMILIHGRGASAEDIMTLTSAITDDQILYAAPQAVSGSWYPYSFLSPIENNQPDLDNSLSVIRKTVEELNARNIASEKIILTGFSQGACLALEYAFRNPGKYGGIAALSGGIISTTAPKGENIFSRTPVFLGCSEQDQHIPLERVKLTEKLFRLMGAEVKTTIYPGSFHGITNDGIDEINKMVRLLKN